MYKKLISNVRIISLLSASVLPSTMAADSSNWKIKATCIHSMGSSHSGGFEAESSEILSLAEKNSILIGEDYSQCYQLSLLKMRGRTNLVLSRLFPEGPIDSLVEDPREESEYTRTMSNREPVMVRLIVEEDQSGTPYLKNMPKRDISAEEEEIHFPTTITMENKVTVRNKGIKGWFRTTKVSVKAKCSLELL